MCIRDRPCAVWELSGATGCQTCAALRACHVRRGHSEAPAAHAAEHGRWRPRAARALASREAPLVQTAGERLAHWPNWATGD
eukprot:2074133-Lingulodinium_polyedra.AAC.1